MLLIRNDEVTRYKGDKMPIGIHYRQKASFTSHQIDYQKGDTIYLFSDGFPDQFGGEHGKKFRLQNFQDLLLTIHGDSMQSQKEMLEKSFHNWKMSFEQVDDILVMGFRL
jgi:serine phosphatase RsbU (regulator of sigma subunit)